MFTIKNLHITLRLWLLTIACTLLVCNAVVLAQETRGAILGTVMDSNSSLVPGATVVITNTETNTSTQVTTNSSGYFEISYLLPSTYSIEVTVTGFKKYVNQGFVLTSGSRSEITVQLEVGDVSEAITITSTPSLLETTTGSGSTTLEQRQIMDLPVLGNSATLLIRSMPGMQWTGQPSYIGLHSNLGASTVSAAGGVGGNEFSLDGVPNLGPSRRTGYLPYTDTVAEVKVETAAFDASRGHTSGATISLLSKSGTNDYHGTVTWQHWQQRFNGTQTTNNAAYWGNIFAAEARGNREEAERLRSSERQDPGRSNNWAAVIGGPVRVPWLYDGRDKLFFFFSYNGVKEVKTEEARELQNTVPTEAHKRGDFSDLLRLGPQYQIYDPRTAREVVGGPCGLNQQGQPIRCVVRDPFPNNQVPILNPLYKFYEAIYPRPNNVRGIVTNDGINNYYASGTPFNWDYKAFNNRIDFRPLSDHQMFARWNYSKFVEDRRDWAYETVRGIRSDLLDRRSIAVTFDHVYTYSSSTIFNWSVAWSRFIDGQTVSEFQRSFKPSTAGLPSYLDEKAGDFTHLPSIDFVSNTYAEIVRGYPTPQRYSVGTLRGEMSKYLGTHSLRIGTDLRNHWRSSDARGQSSGIISYGNAFVRPCSVNSTNPNSQCFFTNAAPGIGLEWAAFMLGAPTSISIDTNDSFYISNKFGGIYAQDDWKLSQTLTLNLGLRYEFELGIRERFNRGHGGFDSSTRLPISDVAEARYAAIAAGITNSQVRQALQANQFSVRGGSLYLGKDGAPDSLNGYKGAWMPRIGFAYQINNKTVLRGGYGLFYDTNNALNNAPDQFGYSRSTVTPITNDNGVRFNPLCSTSGGTDCRLTFNPFPVRADGTRFNVPLGNELGLMARVGRGYNFSPYDWERARQQRWRLGIQREVGGNAVVEIAYLGSYSDNISVNKRLDALPEQYWSSGLVRNNANNTFLTTDIANPFLLANFSSLQRENPTLYADMSSNGFFTGTTRQLHTLLRPFPHIGGNGLRDARVPDGESKYNHLEVSIQKRMSKGLSYTAAYTWASNLERLNYDNEFDEKPTWLPGGNSNPHHLMINGIYELPIGKGKPFFAENKWVNAVLGGWQIGGIYHLQSGRAYNLENWFYYGDNLRDIKLKGDEQSTDAWFNWRLFPGASRDYTASDRTAYEARIRQLVPESVLQQMGRTYSNVTPTDFQPSGFHKRIFPQRLNFLRGDKMSQLDFNIIRRFAVTEGTRLEFRMDLINALNTVQWDLPDLNINSSNFGRLTSQWNTPRWIQLQLRYTF